MFRVLSWAAALALTMAGGANALTVATWDYDATFDPQLTPPFVGAGTLTTTTTVGPGDHALTSLSDLEIEIELGPSSFTLADLVTPIGEISVRLFDTPGGLSAFFINPSPLGSANFENAQNVFLSHEPTDPSGAGLLSGPGPAKLFRMVTNFQQEILVDGSYGGSNANVPVPAAAPLLLGAIGALAAIRRRRAARD